jgi:hypothetical protein
LKSDDRIQGARHETLSIDPPRPLRGDARISHDRCGPGSGFGQGLRRKWAPLGRRRALFDARGLAPRLAFATCGSSLPAGCAALAAFRSFAGPTTALASGFVATLGSDPDPLFSDPDQAADAGEAASRLDAFRAAADDATDAVPASA